MGLGHADGQAAPALGLEVLQPPPGLGRPANVGRVVDLLGQRQDLVLGGGVGGVGVGYLGVALGRVDHGLGQVFRAGPALCEAVTFHRRGGPGVQRDLLDRR